VMVRASEGDSVAAPRSLSSSLIRGTLAGPANENLEPSSMRGLKELAVAVISTTSCIVFLFSWHIIVFDWCVKKMGKYSSCGGRVRSFGGRLFEPAVKRGTGAWGRKKKTEIN